MPIEFRCHRCQKLLRTPDDAAGKQAQCPHCGEVQQIPSPPPAAPPAHGNLVPPAHQGTYVPRSPAPTPDGANPFSPRTPLSGPAAPHEANPYQSPQTPAGLVYPTPPPRIRTGPPWEAQGPSPASFWSTIKSFVTDVGGFFSSMRLSGGIGLPLLYMMITGAIGGVAQVVQQGVLMAMGAMGQQPAMGNPAETAGYVFGMFLGGMCVIMLGALLMSFVTAGIYHLMLSLLGGANQGFEATYRVVAYCSAHTFLMYLIPCCGIHVGAIASLVLPIIGLAYAHETSGWRAAGAVLIPGAGCCVVGVGVFAALIGMNA